jgi:tetratricopeptide (TPR) repeat protein
VMQTPRGASGMPDPDPTTVGLFHAVFLERAAGDLDASPEGRLGQAAFLVLRLIDLLATDRPGTSQDDLFRYQAAATARYCREEVAPCNEVEHLLRLVQSATEAQRRRHPGWLASTMLRYAEVLEDSAKYDEALDVLHSLERVAGTTMTSADAVAAALQMGRVSRESARFGEAEAAYARAGQLAAAAGDPHSVLLSRLGQANVHMARGNLAEAERVNREVLAAAQSVGERDVEARAEHQWGVALGARGQLPDAIPHLWRAFERYNDPVRSLYALHDLGVALSRVGEVDNAEQALRQVVQRGTTQSLTQNAMIELMHCASFRRDRVGFTRWRASCEKARPGMAPNILADYHLKVGIGLARFGQYARAEPELRQAQAVANAHGLHEFEFRIERIRTGLRECAALEPAVPDTVSEPAIPPELLADVASGLVALER